MKITALAPWFGTKRTLAPRIHAELGPHRCYFEPFVGGFGAFLSKPPASSETVNDLHGDVTNLARVVADDDLGPALFERLLRTALCEPMLADADAVVRWGEPGPGLDLDRAAAFFISCWAGRNGECGLKKSERGRTVAMRWNANGGSPGARFRNAVDSIPAWWERLRGVVILRRNGLEMLEDDIDDAAGTAIYLDPPYLVKSDEYSHDFATSAMFGDDHLRMSRAASRFRRARVVVSYYDHPRLDELYPGWTRVRIEVPKNSTHVGGGSVGRAVEVLLINGPSLAGGAK